jgi:cell division protein FtsI (penicillin-binding protein 3)
LGFVAPDGNGKDGVELSLDGELEGHVERLRGLRDRSGRLLFADGLQDDQALAGHNVYLTIDQGIQYVAERELAIAAHTFEAKGGSLVAVDPYTGEILALASWPGYNPNDYAATQPEQRRDRGLSDVFEPGSTMKIFTVAAGLSANLLLPGQQLYCEKGAMPVDNIVIRDTHPAEWLTLSQVLAHSSNICAAKIGLGLGGDRLYEALRRFGFGQETSIPMPGESSGTLRPRGRPWVQVETATASFGQGISVTNLQLAMAVSALANGGNLMQPTLIRKVTTATGELVRQAAPQVLRRAVSQKVAQMLAEMMVAVTEGEGTGVEAAIQGYEVAGKTATAQKTEPGTGRYSLDRFVASFIGFVPAKNPAIAIAVILDEPAVEHAGGSVAAPIFRRVAEMTLKYRGLTPKQSDPAKLSDLAHQPDPARVVYQLVSQAEGKKPPVQQVVDSGPIASGKVRIPDMTGWPMRRALAKVIELGAEPQVMGTGLLARQAPPPGQVVNKGARLVLYFEPAS